jgi:hypothetical protein
MRNAEISSLLLKVFQNFERIDRLVNASFPDIGQVFGKTSIELPRLTPPELGFIKVVSWLYVHIFELGKVGTDFLSKNIFLLNAEQIEYELEFTTRLNNFRTYLQHNLDTRVSRNATIVQTCQTWLKEHCGTPIPETDEKWALCLEQFLEEAHKYLDILLKVIRSIECHSEKTQFSEEWSILLKQFHPPYKFDELIPLVAKDMGRDYIDPIKLRKRAYTRWKEDLSILKWPYCFETVARKMIESELLNENTPQLPITGTDLIDVLGITPGIKLGEALKKAKDIYLRCPCSREKLLEVLKEEYY